ncbi:photosynthetic NDH subunit of subcomplex B 3, chloroplastic [Humulus lupulus]|uniref:photosynthetic NDH subunit of subcomplex B 3, chloroplastic n=1 Tax=Humulus lupulus TaxID=3486 RepID=UPI002B40DD92|nr:photosynthetic NDH subunit of subcomplex B 3, chloroplastic [Humulus lupulus]
MVSLNLTTAITLRPPELTDGAGIRSNSVRFPPASKKPISISFAAASVDTIPSQPEIELEFIGPKPGNDGSYPVERAKAISGEKLLRNIMADNKIELYATYGKVMNCGGGGSCGTCIVEIIDGKDLLNERTNTELKYLKKKPESWRLACQTIVGNKENSGKVVVQRIPQWKK